MMYDYDHDYQWKSSEWWPGLFCSATVSMEPVSKKSEDTALSKCSGFKNIFIPLNVEELPKDPYKI